MVVETEEHAIVSTVVVLGLPSAFVQSLRQVANLRVVESDGDVETALAKCFQYAPCVLMAREQFILSAGPASLSELTRSESNIQIVAVGSADNGVVADLLHLGCAGVLSVATPPKDLGRAIGAVASGELWFPRRVLSSAIRTLLSTVTEKRLTQREKEILHLIGQGLNNREIAERLG